MTKTCYTQTRSCHATRALQLTRFASSPRSSTSQSPRSLLDFSCSANKTFQCFWIIKHSTKVLCGLCTVSNVLSSIITL